MNSNLTINIHYDGEAKVYWAYGKGFGLVLEDESYDGLIDRIRVAAPEIAAENGIHWTTMDIKTKNRKIINPNYEKIKRAVKVKPMKHYLLLIKFDNDEVKVFNCFPLLQDKLFSKIADISYFKTVHIDEMGLVCWDNSTDIDPYRLYENSESIEDFNL